MVRQYAAWGCALCRVQLCDHSQRGEVKALSREVAEPVLLRDS